MSFVRDVAAPLRALQSTIAELLKLVNRGVVDVDTSLADWEHKSLKDKLGHLMQNPTPANIVERVRDR